MWRVYALSGLIACVVAAATTLITTRLTVPSQNATSEPGATARPATAVLEGVAEVPCAKSSDTPAELDVFYKTAFASPPHLSFPEGLDDGCRVADQKAGGFKLQRVATSGRVYSAVKWRAEGVGK